MTTQNIALYNWTSGVIMIVIFGFVCLALIGFIVKSMMSGSKKNDDSIE